MLYYSDKISYGQGDNIPDGFNQISKKEYDSLLAEQTKKREEIIATRNEENKKSYEILRSSGLSDEAIAILAPNLIVAPTTIIEETLYTVNITTKKNKKYAVVHTGTDVDFDEARGDLRTTNPQEAQAYADKVNSKR